MILEEKSLFLPIVPNNKNLLNYFHKEVMRFCDKINAIPIRFVVTETNKKGYNCELGVLLQAEGEEKLFFEIKKKIKKDIIFQFRKREYQNSDNFNAVVLIPTGIGAQLGGHSGDGGAMIRLLASACDNLITHPNTVNAADINEIPDNTLYVEGSVISRLLMGTMGLRKVRSNRVMVVIDEHDTLRFQDLAVNAVSAARVALGLNCSEIIKNQDGFTMEALFSESGRAIGKIEKLEKLMKIIEEKSGEYDAVAITSLIQVPKEFHMNYFVNENIEVNPWGGVEAILTHTISSLYNIPSAHSPMMESYEILNTDVGIVDPRKSAETVSMTYLHCILKGLHRSPKLVELDDKTEVNGLIRAEDISCLIIPEGCIGLPILAAIEQNIDVIIVKENKNEMKNKLEEYPFRKDKIHIVENYWEAVGVMMALKTGIHPSSVRRPIK